MSIAFRECIREAAACDEAAASFSQHWAMGVICDEQAFLSCVSSLDKLLGRPASLDKTDAIVRDRIRDSYFEMIITCCRQTRLNIKELSILLSTMCEHMATGKEKRTFASTGGLVKGVINWARYLDFEPEWHMRLRGDDRPLPSSRNPERDMWGYLRKLYTDPEAARLRLPDGIKAMSPMYSGYESFVRRARREGQDELRRLYGQDTDLSLVTDKPKVDNPDVSSFLSGLRDGSIGELLSSR